MIFGGCTVIGIGIGIYFSGVTDWVFGMPAGILIGIGMGMVIKHLHLCNKVQHGE